MTSSPSPAVILYDGECGLCDRLVQFVLPRDRVGRFQFAALQSPWAQAALRQNGLPTADFDSMVLLDTGRVYVRSDAALRVLSGLPGWGWTTVFTVVPRPVRDSVYRWIARRRKRWFPPPAQCGVPKDGWRERFLT